MNNDAQLSKKAVKVTCRVSVFKVGEVEGLQGLVLALLLSNNHNWWKVVITD